MTGTATPVTLASQQATQALAARLSLWARPGLVIALVGDLGSGKSTFARAFIQSLFHPGVTSDIPSPSFSLVQSYDETRVPVFHADLYRLSSAADIAELGLGEMTGSMMGLVEWADRLSRPVCPDTLEIRLSGRGETRLAEVVPHGAWQAIIARDQVIEGFLSAQGHGTAARQFFEGDASSRRYEQIIADDGTSVLLMDMPTRPDGPPVRNGKPYSAIAHLAEGLAAVVAVNTHLVAEGYSAPRILARDISSGLALIEPLGSLVYGRMMREGADMAEPLAAATEVLADMAARRWPAEVAAAPGVMHHVADYDAEALLIEADLMPSWFHLHVRGHEASQDLKDSFAAEWQKLLPLAQTDHPVWVLRDYHSPNLIWIPQRDGLQRVGLIDTQDAVMGHPAYDLMSLTQDARVDVAPAVAEGLVQHYCRCRAARGAFDEASLRTAYAVLGAQRATKILGIFARLNRRDGKPQYLAHLPRVSRYLAANLAHPALASLRAWYQRHMPEALSGGMV